MAERDEIPDFSTLPDVAWVRVMSFLSLSDRFSVARTCHTLYDVFSHPSLWSTQHFLFLGSDNNYNRRAQPVASAGHYVDLIKNFGQYFQSLTIKVSGHFSTFPEELREVLQQIAERCRLETLSLEIGKLTSRFHTNYGFPPNSAAVQVLASFIRHAFRMKHLHIRSWPMFTDLAERQENCDVFRALEQNEKLKSNLETLTLFWPEENGWTEREPLLLDHDNTIKIVNHFSNLTTLGLRSPMISQELIVLLANSSRVKLEKLKMAIHYIDPERRPNYKIPTISSAAWRALVNRNPDFRVECIVFFATPNMELANMLTPDTPVSEFRYMKYSRIDPMTLTKIHTQYVTTLIKFHSYCDAEHNDGFLLQLCQSCEHMVEFIYHGKIYADTVSALAQLKGTQWKVFEVNGRNVATRTEFDGDDDNIIRRNEAGEFIQVALHRFHASNDEVQYQQMVENVSAALDVPWKPVNV